MTQNHPDVHLLTDYSAGSLPMSSALCVAAHLEYCPDCQAEVDRMNTLGSFMICEHSDDELANSGNLTATSALSSKLVDSVFNALDDMQVSELQAAGSDRQITHDNSASLLPRCLHKLIPGGVEQLDWKKLGASLSIARLALGDTRREVALHRLQPGGGVADHDHRGTEITVVLSGSFSDQQGVYLPGDFLVREAGQSHRPIASKDRECLCLSVLEAPVKFTGPLTRLINPFLKIYPSVV